MSVERLFFYSKSRDAPPGEGAQEHVEDANLYELLAAIPHWRRTLSNFHVSPFTYDGKRWNSIEHVFQGTKIGLVDTDKGASFSLDSGSLLGRSDGQTAQKHRKMVILPEVCLRRWAGMQQSVMAAAARCKYHEDTTAAAVLLATNHAELWHVVPRGAPVRFQHLEMIREELQAQSNSTVPATRQRGHRDSAGGDESYARKRGRDHSDSDGARK